MADSNSPDAGGAEIHTGGGACIAGSVNTGGGDFVGRDQIVQGDAVQGDKITVGDVSGIGIAIGRRASASVQQGPSSAELVQALAPVVEAIQRTAADAAAQATAMQAIADLERELARGKGADDARVAGILDGLADLIPGAVAAVVGAFATPLLSGMAGPVTQYVLGQLRRRQ
jgi:PPE-repeat protein